METLFPHGHVSERGLRGSRDHLTDRLKRCVWRRLTIFFSQVIKETIFLTANDHKETKCKSGRISSLVILPEKQLFITWFTERLKIASIVFFYWKYHFHLTKYCHEKAATEIADPHDAFAVVQRRQMSSVPGGSGENIVYAVLCGGALVGAVSYVSSTVSRQHHS